MMVIFSNFNKQNTKQDKYKISIQKMFCFTTLNDFYPSMHQSHNVMKNPETYTEFPKQPFFYYMITIRIQLNETYGYNYI